MLANSLNVNEISSIASSVFLIVFGVVNLAAFRDAIGSPLGRSVAFGGFAGCVVSLVLLLVDTATHQLLALDILGLMIVASIAGEALWLNRRRELGLGGTLDSGM